MLIFSSVFDFRWILGARQPTTHNCRSPWLYKLVILYKNIVVSEWVLLGKVPLGVVPYRLKTTLEMVPDQRPRETNAIREPYHL